MNTTPSATLVEYYSAIPPNLLWALKRYLTNGIAPGSFLCCLLCNDLYGAVGHADRNSLAVLKELVAFLRSRAPCKAFGSSDRYYKWVTYDTVRNSEMASCLGQDALRILDACLEAQEKSLKSSAILHDGP